MKRLFYVAVLLTLMTGIAFAGGIINPGAGGGGGSGTVSAGTQGQLGFYNANGTTITGTPGITISTTGAVAVPALNVAGFVTNTSGGVLGTTPGVAASGDVSISTTGAMTVTAIEGISAGGLASVGTAGYFIEYNGSGWVPALPAAVPAGTTGQIQYNSGSSTFAAAGGVYVGTTNYMGIGTAAPTSSSNIGTSGLAIYGAPGANNMWIGQVTPTDNAIWMGTSTPGVSNYALSGGAGDTSTIINIPPASGGKFVIDYNNARIAFFNSTGGLSLGTSGGSLASTLDVTGNAVVGAYDAIAPSNGLYVAGEAAIGTATVNSSNALEVNGAASIGYPDVYGGSANGLIVRGNVSIGTSSGTSPLEINGGTNKDLRLFGAVHLSNGGYIDGSNDAGNAFQGLELEGAPTVFNAYSSGLVAIGTPTPIGTALVSVYVGTASWGVLALQNGTGTCVHAPGTSTETVTCSSDEKLKKDIVDTNVDGLAWVNSFRIRDFTVKATGEHRTGVIAQEVRTTQPDMVTIGADGILSVQEPDPWKIIKALQDQQREIEATTGAFPFHKCFFGLVVCPN